MGKPLKDLTGMKFGMLTVVNRAAKNKGSYAAWHCVCSCDNHTELDVCGHQLRSGRTKSCGCLRRAPSKFVKNLSGMSFNDIRVIERAGTIGRSTMWLCLCHCGNRFIARQWSLSNGKTTSCGCLTKTNIGKANSANLIGEKFGRLTVVDRIGSNKWRKAIWKCVCECGNETSAATDSLIWGGIKSCGCLLKEAITIHGMTRTKEYKRFKANRRKEMEIILDSEWTVSMEVALRKLFRTCVVCGGIDRLSTAHVYSLKNGNGLRPGNAIVLCTPCNSKQWIYPPDNLPKSLPPDAGQKMLEAAESFRAYWESSNKGVARLSRLMTQEE